MFPIGYLLVPLGLLLEVLIFWRALRLRLYRRYPFFYVYLSYVFARTVTLLLLMQLKVPAYATVYWYSELVAVALQFSVGWEVFRQSFPPRTPIRSVVGVIVVVIFVVLAAFFVASEKKALWIPLLERQASLVVACWLLVTLLLARYYALPLGRNVWGMALGLGMYVSVSMMNFAAFDLSASFATVWGYIRRLSFVGMLGVWCWALWVYAPNPKPVSAGAEVTEKDLAAWSRAWDEMRAALRRTVGL